MGVGRLYCLPLLLSRQPSARKRTIHSLITCQSLQTKLALLYFFGTNSGHRDKQPLRNELKGGWRDSDGSNGTSGVKTRTVIKMSCEGVIKDNAAGLIHVPFQSNINVNFTVHI